MRYDCIVIGAGLVGLSTAWHIQKNNPKIRVAILEKENKESQHQSGNNSGVIHSGIYYNPKSLKAKNCILGYESIIHFAQQNDISYDLCGKIIVATEKKELPILDAIYKRGIENGLNGLKILSREEFREIEPHCEGLRAIKVPQTGIIDYPGVARKLKEKFIEAGGEIYFNQKVNDICRMPDGFMVETDTTQWQARQLVTCAGLYSDKLASMTETENNLRIIPFRGEYYELTQEAKHLVKNLIYPVPDPNFPFLGVHFTRMINGGIEAGPNAVLAFRREGYRFRDFDFFENIDTFSWPGFWKIFAKYGNTGMGEIHRSLSKKAFTQALQKLIPEIQENHLQEGGAGVRAQACHRDGRLIDDFDILQKKGAVHVRNAPSPAATSCLAIGQYIAENFKLK